MQFVAPVLSSRGRWLTGQGVAKKLVESGPHLFLLFSSRDAAENGPHLAHVSPEGCDQLAITRVKVVKPIVLPERLRLRCVLLLNLAPLLSRFCIDQFVSKLPQHAGSV